MILSPVVAKRFMLLAAGFAAYAGVITAVSIVLGDEFMGLGNLIDVAIYLGLAYGVYRASRVAAISLFAYYLVSRLIMYGLTGDLGRLLSIAPVTYAFLFYLGIAGTFAHHKLTNQGVRDARRRSEVPAADP